MKNSKKVFAAILTLVLAAGGFAALKAEASKQSQIGRARDAERLSVSFNSENADEASVSSTVESVAETTTAAPSTTASETTASSATKSETTTSSSDYSFSRVGNANRTVTVGKEIELEVNKKGSLRDSDLSWSIADTSILAFDDNETTGDDVELRALKAGKTTVTCYNSKTKESIVFTITVEESKATTESTIKQVGSSTIYVELGDDEELEVKASNVSSKNLKWTIADTSILRFEDNESYGTEVDVIGLKLGQTTVTCTNLVTNKSVTYTVIVVADDND